MESLNNFRVGRFQCGDEKPYQEVGQLKVRDKENKHPVGQFTIGDFAQLFVGVVNGIHLMHEHVFGSETPVISVTGSPSSLSED